MRGDFSRDSYNTTRSFTRVLSQQGRLIVDADWNEQAAIIQRQFRALVSDLIDWHGGANVTPGASNPYPTGGAAPTGAFVIAFDESTKEITVRGGRYYVNGRLIELPTTVDYDAIPLNEVAAPATHRLVFVDVWEHLVTAGTYPDLRDPALGGLDTCARVELRVDFRVLAIDPTAVLTPANVFRQFLVKYVPAPSPIDPREPGDQSALPQLKASVTPPAADPQECAGEVAAGYTGLENQLYRIEVQRGGKAFWDGGRDANGAPVLAADLPPTFKWSRDNGSVLYAIKTLDVNASGNLTLVTKWTDSCRQFKQGNWIELLRDDRESGVLVLVAWVKDDDEVISVGFTLPDDLSVAGKQELNDLVSYQGVRLARRWDHRARRDYPLSEGAIIIKQLTAVEPWTSIEIPLEDGLRVQLRVRPDSNAPITELRAGDYWLVPARSNTGTILWPPENSSQGFAPARYAEHHYAPIAVVDPPAPAVPVTPITDKRRPIVPL